MNLSNTETYTIKEVADMTGFKTHVIRFYEKEFDLEIPRNDENNRRYFTYKEVEDLIQIKTLQERGLTNKQIRQIIKSPKVIIENSNTEVAVTNPNGEMTMPQNYQSEEWLKEALQFIRLELQETVKSLDYGKELEVLTEKIDDLRMQLNREDKDVLVCENAKLRMKLKEKSYEVAELKDKVKREEYKSKSFFQKLFGPKDKTEIKI